MANKYTNRNLLDYNFNENDYEDVSLAKKAANDAATKYNSIGEHAFEKEDLFSQASKALTDRKAFSYDLNGDMLYQQYKDNYITQGKQAMRDTMGQAAAMTGGYGNSYAATVGNQTYQGYLQGLNDKIPELYQLAMQKYNMEGEQLKTAYDVLNNEKNTSYNTWKDKKQMALDEMTTLNQLYDAAYSRQQTNYNNTIGTNNENYWNEYNTGYKAEQDSIANGIAQAQLKLQQDSQKIAELQAGVVRDKNGNIVGVSKGTGDGYTLTKDQEERYLGYIKDGDLDAATQYLEAMRGNGLSDEQAGYWLGFIPESYFDGTVMPNNTVGGKNYTYAGSARDEFDSNARDNYKKRK